MDQTTSHPTPTAPDNGEPLSSRARGDARRAVPPPDAAVRGKWTLRNWAWFLLKNVLGWALILSSFVLGPLVPGPGGIPIFLVGFGLITFPGKRRMTARVLSGRPTSAGRKSYRRAAAGVAVVVPVGVVVYLLLAKKLPPAWTASLGRVLLMALAYAACAVALWFAALKVAPLVNWLLRMVAKARRKARPWM